MLNSIRLLRSSIFLTIVVIALGAYTRLSDAGLGCPDWPGCYGHLTVPSNEVDIAVANFVYAERPLEHGKAWLEMIHRYFAGGLGLLLWFTSYYFIKQGIGLLLPLLLSALVVVQALLGMWTVTMMLNPVIVVLHLVGGFSLLATQVVLYARCACPPSLLQSRFTASALRLGLLALIVVFIQILLGAWTSTNYAALVCTSLPVCESQWWARIDLRGAFVFWESLSGYDNYEFGVLDYDARMTIHVVHRLGAMCVTLAVMLFAWKLWQSKRRRFSAYVVALLAIQILLGVSNIVFSLPIVIAVLHNLGGALLFSCIAYICYALNQSHGLKYYSAL